MVRTHRFILVFMTIALLALAACSSEPEPAPIVQEPVVCAQDVQECPDGSFVGRDAANNCDFKACPVVVPEAPVEPQVNVTETPAVSSNESDEIFLGNIPDLLQSLEILDAMFTQYETACGAQLECKASDINKEYAKEDIIALDGIINVLGWYDTYFKEHPQSTLSAFDDVSREQEAELMEGALADATYVRDMLKDLTS